MIAQMMRFIMRACDVAMPWWRVIPSRQTNFWWEEEISELRSACFRIRSVCQRSRKRPDFVEKRQIYAKLQGWLKQAISLAREDVSRNYARRQTKIFVEQAT